MIVDPDEKKVKIYYNGVLMGEVTYDLDLKNNCTIHKLLLGIWVDRVGAQSQQNMNMKSFRVYDRILTETEVRKNAQIDEMRFGI